MAYVSGFLLAVPEDKKQEYLDMAKAAWEIFKDHGCLAMQENWGENVPDGKVTSFPMAVQKKEGEVVVFSWMEWPDKDTADKGFEAMMQDPRMEKIQVMPFDGMRMMWGGFEPLIRMEA
ncbi:DUF1428 domain-containing protein [Sulfitobacter sp. D35]|uniref:DUF1428 domain-containing protein n=1 Tax=Sulfitobacter sp. D35 TaxID=3083252 RepID=UPI00296FDBAA|nr:DUF1428 domain-containing protein [Sulfitobacter sp. D35]MDW4497556.1 DUF1428 domain-containing protein [Sulfitobacter sp. D35]